jgi:16S rRNA (cytosine967-C5)-methyltransferase
VSVLQRAENTLAPLDAPLSQALEQTDPRDRALLQELVLGTVRWRRRLDAVLEEVANRKLGAIDRGLVWPFRLALYQLFFLDRMPPHPIVHEAVEQALRATHRGGASFANAVLRRVAKQRDLAAWPVRHGNEVERLAVEHSHPDFLVARWLAEFGQAETLRLLEINNQRKPMHLLAFRDRGGREQLAERLIDEEICVTPSGLAPCGLIVRRGRALETEAFSDGGFYVQDEASQVAALVPPPRAGERILDVAAAPGGKSFSLLAYQPLLEITATDRSIPRLATMQRNTRRLRSESLRLLASDGHSPATRALFDRVVVDVPCSGTGTLRKNPELKWRLRPEELERLTKEGAELALATASSVAAGGLLVLIACSIESQEVLVPLERVLSSRPDFAPLELDSYHELFVQRGLRPRTGLWQIPPEGDHDGFTVAVARRR